MRVKNLDFFTRAIFSTEEEEEEEAVTTAALQVVNLEINRSTCTAPTAFDRKEAGRDPSHVARSDRCQRVVKIGWVAKCLLQPWIIALLTHDICDIGSVEYFLAPLFVEYGLLTTLRFGISFCVCS